MPRPISHRTSLYFSIYIGHQTVRAATVSIAHLSPTAFLKQIWAAARVPFYLICLEFAALYGAFSPLAGRALFAKVESRFHDGKGLHESVQYQKKIDILETCKNSLIDLDYPLAFFAAYCMQPFGKITDPHVISVRQIPPAAFNYPDGIRRRGFSYSPPRLSRAWFWG